MGATSGKQVDGRLEYPGRNARQGEIILRTRWRRIVFITGLVGIVILAALLNWGM